jgi:flagellar biogenesis protein FliO
MNERVNRMQVSTSQRAAVSIVDAFRLMLERLGAFSRQVLQRNRSRRLQLCETISLGNRGFVAVVGYQDQRFLVGGTNSSIVLLADLHGVNDCGERESCHQGDNRQPGKSAGGRTSKNELAEIAQDERQQEAHNFLSC